MPSSLPMRRPALSDGFVSAKTELPIDPARHGESKSFEPVRRLKIAPLSSVFTSLPCATLRSVITHSTSMVSRLGELVSRSRGVLVAAAGHSKSFARSAWSNHRAWEL